MITQEEQEYINIEVCSCIQTFGVQDAAFAIAADAESLSELEQDLRDWLDNEQRFSTTYGGWATEWDFETGRPTEFIWDRLPKGVFLDASVDMSEVIDTVIGMLPEEHPLRQEER